MPWETINPSWSALNAQRRYPLAADATARDTTGEFALPDDFLTWVGLPVHAGFDVEPARFFVKHVGAYGTGYSVVIGYQPATGAAVSVATALIPAQGFARDSVYGLVGIAPFGDSWGRLQVGSLDGIAGQPPGYWDFDLDGGRLEPDAIRPMIRGVSSLVVVNGTERSAPLQGDVALVAGANCRLDVVLVDGQDPQVVINFVEGAGTVAPCDCAGSAADRVPIARIGGVAAGPDGDFTIQGSDCLRVEPIAHGIRLVDVCSAPCCGCPELEAITADLQRLQQERAVSQDFVARLQVAVDTMNQVVLGSKLSDKVCFPPT